MNNRTYLRPGCTCFLQLVEGVRIRGIFKGFSLLCEENVLVMVAPGGSLSLVPESKILHLDLLEMPEPENGEPKGKGSEHWYG